MFHYFVEAGIHMKNEETVEFSGGVEYEVKVWENCQIHVCERVEECDHAETPENKGNICRNERLRVKTIDKIIEIVIRI